ncbi:hypothetical protein D3C81_1653090 [compost metagenome]
MVRLAKPCLNVQPFSSVTTEVPFMSAIQTIRSSAKSKTAQYILLPEPVKRGIVTEQRRRHNFTIRQDSRWMGKEIYTWRIRLIT